MAGLWVLEPLLVLIFSTMVLRFLSVAAVMQQQRRFAGLVPESAPSPATSGEDGLRLEKQRLRKEISLRLASVSRTEVDAQSQRVWNHLSGLPCVRRAAAGGLVSLYLPMEGGAEVDTWLFAELFLAQGSSIVVPLVHGKRPKDMSMVVAPSMHALRALELDRWRIPAPPREWLQRGGDATDSGDIQLIIVPCVGLDDKCRRLGHGKGYYDHFIERATEARVRRGLEAPVTVGLALEAQFVSDIPTGQHDKTLDFVVHPNGIVEPESTAQTTKTRNGVFFRT